uniref:FBA_2 domain-containing protein n=1 Tax=Steinernema glaseri TaxID=37863 RepID=A0A1I8AA79_9BILA
MHPVTPHRIHSLRAHLLAIPRSKPFQYGYRPSGFHRICPPTLNRGSLIATYFPSDLRNLALPWTFRYNLRGFSHLKKRLLSREVIRKIARSTTNFTLDTNYKCLRAAHLEQWPSIADDDEVTFQLLANLQAPKKELIVDVASLSRWYGDRGSRHSYFWRSFTSLSLRKGSYLSTPFDDCLPTVAQFMKDIVPMARLQRINMDTSVVYGIHYIAALLPASIWIEHLLSESCTGSDFHFGPKAAEVTSEVIQRWREIDPRRLPQKTFSGMWMNSANTREFSEFDMELADLPLRQKIDRIVADANRKKVETRIEYIEHPVYPGFRICVVFIGAGETKQEFGETKKWTKEDWFSRAPCTLHIE